MSGADANWNGTYFPAIIDSNSSISFSVLLRIPDFMFTKF